MRLAIWNLMLLGLLSSTLLWGQTEAIQRILSAQATVIEKVEELNDSAYYNTGHQRKQYAQSALQLAESERYLKGLGDGYLRLGQAHSEQQVYHLAKLYLRKGIAWRRHIARSKKSADSLSLATGYILLGQCFDAQRQYDSAQLAYKEALRQYPAKPALSLLALYNSYGASLNEQGQYLAAQGKFRRAYRAYAALDSKQRKDPELPIELANLRMSYAMLLQEHLMRPRAARDSLLRSRADFEKSPLKRPYLGNCLLLLGNNAYFANELELAKGYYREADRHLLEHQQVERALVFKNMGRIFLDQGKFNKAEQFFSICEKKSRPLGDSVVWADALYELGNLHYEQDQYPQAIAQYQRALSLRPSDLLLQGRILFFLSDAQQELGQSQAAQATEKDLSVLLERIEEQQGSVAFQEILNYQMGKQRVLKTLVRTQNENLRQRLWGIGLGLGGLLLLLLLAYWLQRQKRLAAQQSATLAQQQEAIAVQEKMQVLQEKELETHYARLEAQEKVQQKIGQELHDDVGAMLATVKMKLLSEQEVLDHFPKEKTREYAQANRLLNEACDKVRKLSHEFSEALLKKFGLKAQLEALQDAISQAEKLEVEMSTHGLQKRLDFELELNLYRIIQELVHNVIKHAKASQISIEVNYLKDKVNLVVEDNGQGFDWDQVKANPGLGMLNLEARVHGLNGEIHFDTIVGKSTTVMVRIPISDKLSLPQ